jgi:hypothetical protein
VPHPSTATPAVNGLWRILIHDPEPGDPKWLLASVGGPADVRPASPSENAPDEVTAAWVRARLGQPAAMLVVMPRALAWRVDADR